jgi:arsenate reductase (glutaredoxin)
MKATIYHNPMCGTSRKTLEILRDSGFDVWIREYLKDPPSRNELMRMYDRAGITPREGLRTKEPLVDELGLKRPDVTDEDILDAMLKHPILIERPLVETDKVFASADRKRRCARLSDPFSAPREDGNQGLLQEQKRDSRVRGNDG